MTLLYPIWLVVAIPLALTLWLWPMPSRWLLLFRIPALILLLLALCGLSVTLERRATIVVVADRSFSVGDADDRQTGTIGLVQKAAKPDEHLGVVTFGQDVNVERAPKSGPFESFAAKVDREGSRLSEAIEKALAMIPRGDSGRLLVLSDGRWTGLPPDGVTSQAASRGIAIDYRPLGRPTTNDVAVARIGTPTAVSPGEAFLVHAWIKTPVSQKIAFELWRGDKRIAAGARKFAAGSSRLVFRDQASGAGTHSYVLKIRSESEDPVQENNRARFLVQVKAPRSVLVVTRSETSRFGQLLRDNKIKTKVLKPEQCDWSLESLSQHSAVILDDVPAGKIGTVGMETLASWVQQAGAGLMMTGGPDSYGPGGYYKSPLEPIMPVSMELRQEHRKLSLAIVVALDRSGSMQMPVAGGRVKMDLANLAAAQVLDLLSPNDELGVLAVDSAPHVIQELTQLSDKGPIRTKILSISAGGGGIFVYVALQQAARMLRQAKAGTKQIILIADAAAAEQPGKYRELLRACRGVGMTVSVIGLGDKSDPDAKLLEDIARRGNGRCFFTDSPEELPRLFAQDTFVIARNTFVTDPTKVKVTPFLSTLVGSSSIGNLPSVGGYNLCYLRPRASLAVRTVDEYKAPLVAAWQAGTGRVVCYTGQVDGEHTGPIGLWDDYSSLIASLARWCSGQTGDLPGDLFLTQSVEKGVATVKLHLDPDRDQEPFSQPPKVTTLHALPGVKPRADNTKMQWEDADTVAVKIPLQTADTALATVNIPNFGPVTLAPVCLPYSPEHRPVEGEGRLGILKRLARRTGGKERLDVAGIWQDVPRQSQLVPLTTWLLTAAVILLLLEVLERQTSLLSLALRSVPFLAGGLRGIRLPRRQRRVEVAAEPPPASETKEKKREKSKPVADAPEQDDLLAALRRARSKK